MEKYNWSRKNASLQDCDAEWCDRQALAFGGGGLLPASSSTLKLECSVLSNVWRHFPENHNPDVHQHKNFEFYVACTVLF